MFRPEHSRNSAAAVPELGCRRKGVCHLTAAGQDVVQCHDPFPDQIDGVRSMTLEQLRIFIAVAEKQHVTQAASQLNLTQSATSAAIAALETRYAIKLFDRVGRGIVLTQTGRDFLNEAHAVVARAQAAAPGLNYFGCLKRRSLTVATPPTVANYLLPPPIEAFREAPPRTHPHLSVP